MKVYSKEDLVGLFGTPDEEFKTKFNNTIAKLITEEPGNPKQPVRRVHWKMITIIVIVFAIAMSGAAYAISQFNMRVVGQTDNVNIGAAWKLVAVPEDYYETSETVLTSMFYRTDFKKEQLPRFIEEKAQALRALLAKEIYSSDGEPFDLMVLDPGTNEYYADDRGLKIYNEAGEELARIEWDRIGNNGEPIGLQFYTKAEADAQREAELTGKYGIKVTSDYTEAAQQLGKDFRLPTVYIDDFDPPEYRIHERFTPILGNIDGVIEYGDTFGAAVYVRYNGNPGLYFFVEEIIGDTTPREWETPGALIEECIIATKTVYRVTDSDLVRYVWEHDSLIYMLFQSRIDTNEFSDEQFMEIILSMIQ